jgi:transposase
VLRVARCSARHDRTEALNQMRSLVCTAPEPLRESLRDLTGHQLVVTAAALRPGAEVSVLSATKTALRELAHRAQYLRAQIKILDGQLRPLVAATAPQMVTRHGVGTDTAGSLLVAAGDNPGRLRNEAAFAHLCGSAPIEASSGKVVRHRLNRGGDRQANHALWRIAMTRMSSHPQTRAYVIKRTADGKSKRDILRCPKRAIARELFPLLTQEKVDWWSTSSVSAGSSASRRQGAGHGHRERRPSSPGGVCRPRRYRRRHQPTFRRVRHA